MEVCYTAIIGNYDQLKEPLWIDNKKWRFVCYTTENIQSQNWEIIKIAKEHDSVRQARKIKISSNFAADYSLWIDGSVQVIGNLNEFTQQLKQYDISAMFHPHRKNLIEECAAIIKYKKGNEMIARSQVLKYRLENYHCNDLTATGIVYRKNNNNTQHQAKIWLNEVMTKSHRDQMSFDYSCWKSGISPYKFPYSVINSSVFRHSQHLHKMK